MEGGTHHHCGLFDFSVKDVYLAVGLFSASCANPEASGVGLLGQCGARTCAVSPAVLVSEAGQDKEKPAPLLTSFVFWRIT